MSAPPPRVAIVHDPLVQDGGAEQVVRSLRRIWPEAPLYTFMCQRGALRPDFDDRDIRTSAVARLPGATRYRRALLPLIPWSYGRFDLRAYDVVISSTAGFAKAVRPPPSTVHICYCHTPMRYLWSAPRAYVRELDDPWPVKLAGLAVQPVLRGIDRRAAQRVDVFVANSGHIARRIARYYDRRATVVYPPVALDAFEVGAVRADYCLVAARLFAYKRVDLAIAAFDRLGWPLKVMGDGPERSRLQALAGPNVEFLGSVSDERRRKLFGEARALVNPQEEDFGLTMVEALASGTPVIAYASGGAAEILQDRVTGRLFDRQTTDELVRVLVDFDADSFDRQALRRRAEEFSEAAFARGMCAVVDGAYDAARSTDGWSNTSRRKPSM